MTATGPRCKEIWSPIESEASDGKNEGIDLSTPKNGITPLEQGLPFPSFPVPPTFPFGPFGFPRMPLMIPPFNQALLAICTKSFQRLPSPPQPRHLGPKQPSKPKSSSSKTTHPTTHNPIVNEILKDSLSEQHPINHNVCAVCGEGFRLTGDLVHHMRREKCRWIPKASDEVSPYQLTKRGHK